MITYLMKNMGTIVVGLLLLAMVLAIIVNMIRNKRKGKHLGCDCGTCSNSSYCRQK